MINIKPSILLAALSIIALGVSSNPSFAHGKHRAQANIINSSTRDLKLLVYNGNDFERTVPHKVYNTKPGENQRIKCHGKGKGRCWVKVQKGSSTYYDEFTIDKDETCNINVNRNKLTRNCE